MCIYKESKPSQTVEQYIDAFKSKKPSGQVMVELPSSRLSAQAQFVKGCEPRIAWQVFSSPSCQNCSSRHARGSSTPKGRNNIYKNV